MLPPRRNPPLRPLRFRNPPLRPLPHRYVPTHLLHKVQRLRHRLFLLAQRLSRTPRG
jgi:hypothetical protein